MYQWKHEAQEQLEALLFDHVKAADFPCVGAKAALARGTLEVLACDRIDSAWIVRKPTKDRIVTSLEVFDADGTLMAMLFGARKPGRPEQGGWRALVTAAA